MTVILTSPPSHARATGLSPAASRLLGEASVALSRHQPDAAEQILVETLKIAPSCAEGHRLMGIALQMRGKNIEAIGHLRRAFVCCPEDAVIHMNLGSSLYENGCIDEALALLQRACELAPSTAAPWYNLGKALKMQLHIERACVPLQRALSIDPAHIQARIALANAQTSLGDIAAAIVNYREVLRLRPDDSTAWFALANLKTERLGASDVAQLKKVFRQAGATDDANMHIGFALAKALEDQGDYPASFEVLREANRIKRICTPWDAGAQRAHVDAIIAAFAEPAPPPADATLGQEVILIVSLPRSGSTLTEQILASHPQVEGANEITDLPAVIEGESRRRGQPFPAWVNSATAEDWSRLGREYLARTERWRQHRPRFTDKNLVTWQLAGAALRMLPAAKLVSSHRDPLETCFSCYRQLFSTGNEFSYDLDDMASYYADYDRLSRHWQRCFPQHIFDHEYESLLVDTEPHIRRLLDFCGLTFDPACVAFHQTSRAVLSTASAAQVRQPLRSDTAHSARYADELAPLRAKLRAAGVIQGDIELPVRG